MHPTSHSFQPTGPKQAGKEVKKTVNVQPAVKKRPLPEWNSETSNHKYFDVNIDIREKRL